MPGFIKLYRDLRDNWIWKDKPFAKGQAWVDIMFRCNHKCDKIPHNNGFIWILRGQFVSSNYKLAEDWGWSESGVRRFMKILSEDGMITIKSLGRRTLYEVSNYCAFQALEQSELYQNIDAQNAHKRRANDAQNAPNKNVKNIKNDKNKEVIYTEIESLILDHWNSKDITQSQKTESLQKSIKAALKKFSKEQIIQAIDNYSTIFKDKNYFYSHIWYLDKFLKQDNGVPDFIDTGQKWVNYKNDKKKSPQGGGMPQAGNFEQRKYNKEYLDSLYENS